MLSIGEFSKICGVSTKTLRYYAEIKLILPSEINLENGYRYYSIDQLETMLFINRLKSYNFSLEEIKSILDSKELQDEKLYSALIEKKKKIKKQVEEYEKSIDQLEQDILHLKEGKSIMSYMDDIDIELVEMPTMRLLFIRKMVQKNDFPDAYNTCFGKIIKRMQDEGLTMIHSPMVLFHDDEFNAFGLDTEFAIAIEEYVTGTRDFEPALCLKTVLKGTYRDLSSIYVKQVEWAQKHGYTCSDALFEMYVTDPSQVTNEDDLVTEIYYPIKKQKH